MHIQLRFDPTECRWVGSVIGCNGLPDGCEWPGHDHLRNQPLCALLADLRKRAPGVEIRIDQASKLHYELWKMQRQLLDGYSLDAEGWQDWPAHEGG